MSTVRGGFTVVVGAFQVTRLIVTAFAGGVLLLWLVAWVLTDGGATGWQPEALPGSPTGAQAHTYTIVAHALVEAPALLGGALFLLLGTTPVVWLALPVYLLGLALTWPRADWFEEART